MTNKEINIAIAEIVGTANRWVLKKRGLYYRHGGAGYTAHLSEAWIVDEETADKHVYPHDEPVTKERAPAVNYTGDLNAMHEVEKILTDAQFEDYFDELEGQVPFARPDRKRRHVCSAKARQRAEAFLRALGKWKEGA